MTRKLLPVALVLTFLSASVGLAQTFKDGPHLGFPMGGDTEDPDVAFGWQVLYEYNDLWSADLMLTRMVDSFDGTQLGVGAFPTAGSMKLETWSLAASARAGMLVGERIYVYVSGGFGYYFFTERDMQDIRRNLADSTVPGPNGDRVTDAEVSLDDSFGYQFGGGMEWLIKKSWELFVDYRLVYLDADSSLTLVETVPTSDIGKSKIGTEQDGTFDYNHGILRVGINYRF